MDDYSAENQELLERFEKALQAGKDSGDWFDEDELLTIFDYAGDNGNDYIRAEALMWAARYFPDSEPLRERRAVFYADLIGDDAVRRFTANSAAADGGQPSLLTTIVAARADQRDPAKARRVIADIVDSYTDIDDEEIIQLVGYAGETGNLDWMVKNLDALKKKVIYKPALLYEIAAEAIDAGDYGTALPLLDDLVNEMPYNEEYWALMAEAQMNLEQPDKALESIDMALAINPDSKTSIATKAMLLQQKGAVSELRQLYDEHPDVAQTSESLLQAIWRQVEKDGAVRREAIAIARRHLESFPYDQTMLTALLFLDPDGCTRQLDAFWKEWNDDAMAATDSTPSWADWALQLTQHGNWRGALTVLDFYTSHCDIYNEPEAQTLMQVTTSYCECYLRLKMFDRLIARVQRMADAKVPATPYIQLACIIALVHKHDHMGVVKQVAAFTTSLREMEKADLPFDSYNPLNDYTFRITTSWLSQEYARLMELLITPGFDPDSYDPLNLW